MFINLNEAKKLLKPRVEKGTSLTALFSVLRRSMYSIHFGDYPLLSLAVGELRKKREVSFEEIEKACSKSKELKNNPSLAHSF